MLVVMLSFETSNVECLRKCCGLVIYIMNRPAGF